MTSDMRRALAGLVCTTVWHGTREQKQWLADQVTIMPFEYSPTERIVSLAEAVASEADVMRLLHMCSEDLYEIEEMFLCANCRDEGVVLDGDNRWHRCFQCNPYEPKPVKEKAK